MTPINTDCPTPAHILLRRMEAYNPVLDTALDLRVREGVTEYGEPLTVDSRINGEPLTMHNAIKDSRDECLDAVLYATIAIEAANVKGVTVDPGVVAALNQMIFAATHLTHVIAQSSSAGTSCSDGVCRVTG